MRVVCDEIFITTNDGSYERRGLATDLLKELLGKYTVNRVYAIGSVEMMQAASQMTKEKNIPLRVTVNPYMVNGLGLCGSCRVMVDGQIRLACVDGPEFDGHTMDYQVLSQRMNELESRIWENQAPLITPRGQGLTGLMKSLWGSTKK
jgi:ferredoxin--NADP+ reductase